MKYKAQKNNRINYGFMGFTTFENGWWFHETRKEWVDHNDPAYVSEYNGYTSHQPCCSMKAFRRKLKKCPKGVEFILCSRWVGYDIIGKNTSI